MDVQNAPKKSAKLFVMPCPRCGRDMQRLPRLGVDYFVNGITFNLLELKRYKCFGCMWTGLRARGMEREAERLKIPENPN